LKTWFSALQNRELGSSTGPRTSAVRFPPATIRKLFWQFSGLSVRGGNLIKRCGMSVQHQGD
jgi:hypothetical protein